MTIAVKKTCAECRVRKDLADFHKDRNRKDGLAYRCRVCVNDRRRRNYAANLDREHAKNRRFREAHPHYARDYSRRIAAAKKAASAIEPEPIKPKPAKRWLRRLLRKT
jgi:hypothetical protein